MAEFKCWDTINAERENAMVVDAYSPMRAAEDFADLQLEVGDGDLFSVLDDLGNVWVYEVGWVDHPPAWKDRIGEVGSIRARRLLSDYEAEEVSRG